MNRKGVTWAIAGLALAGALVGGAGIAVAATGTPQSSPSPSSTSPVDPPYGHMGGMAGTGDMGDMAGMGFGENSAMAAAADYLGVSLTDLRADLQGGQSLADVAAAQGKSVAGLEDAMIAAMSSHLDANTTLTAEEKAAALAAMKSHLDVMVTATHSPGSGIGTTGRRNGQHDGAVAHCCVPPSPAGRRCAEKGPGLRFEQGDLGRERAMRRVLVVDDEPHIRTVLRGYLQADGFEVAEAADGAAALAAMRDQPPDLVLLDVMMPGIDGLEVLRQLRTFSDVYVILVTARAEEVDKLVGLGVGADDYVTKPFSPREVTARVKAVLRRDRGVRTAPRSHPPF